MKNSFEYIIQTKKSKVFKFRNIIKANKRNLIIMFEPNSIRSLLKKRNMGKLSSENEIGKEEKDKLSKTCSDFSNFSKNNTDPDLQSVIQAKMMIKQIDHDVSKIRTWREHQKQLLQQKLKSNQQLYNLSKDEYEKYIDQRIEQEMIENKKLIQKMKISENKLKRNHQNNSIVVDNSNSETLQSSEGGQPYQDWEGGLYDPDLMASIAQADEKINQKKYMKSEIAEGFNDNNQAFLNSMNQLTCSDIFSKKSKVQDPLVNKNQKKQEIKTVDKDLLRKELDDIDRQLREMEDLLKD